MEPLEIELKTLTPLWTGGVDRTSDRLHETGLIGSLRWWYEALVRGLGGYACDPTDEKAKCKDYDLSKGARSICAACYLFGATGWARLFSLQADTRGIQNHPLHFYSPANKRWLGSIFGGVSRNNRIDGMHVPFGTMRLIAVGRGVDDDYALGQLALALAYAAGYGGLGTKLQHGFGQIRIPGVSQESSDRSVNELARRKREFLQGRNEEKWPSDTTRFIRRYRIDGNNPVFQAIRSPKNLIGERTQDFSYIPCAFDLRYRSSQIDGRQLGFREWLRNRGWGKDKISELLGETQARHDQDRSASRLCMSMPWRDGQRGYMVRVFGFAPPMLSTDSITAELDAYMNHLFGCRPVGEE